MLAWFRRIAVSFATVLALFVLVGMLLPSEWRVEETRWMKAPPSLISSLLQTRMGWKRWHQAWVPKLDPSYAFVVGKGPDRGVGMDFSWTGGPEIAKGRVVIDAWIAAQRIGYTQTFHEPDMVIRGDIRLTAKDGGTDVRWSESSELGADPIARWMGLLGNPAVEQEFKLGLDALQEIVEADAVEASILDAVHNPPEAAEAPR